MANFNVYDNVDVLAVNYEKLKEENRQLIGHIKSLENDIDKLCNEIKSMKIKQNDLTRNISELYKTAKCEIERKDRMIANLRTELKAANSKPAPFYHKTPPYHFQQQEKQQFFNKSHSQHIPNSHNQHIPSSQNEHISSSYNQHIPSSHNQHNPSLHNHHNPSLHNQHNPSLHNQQNPSSHKQNNELHQYNSGLQQQNRGSRHYKSSSQDKGGSHQQHRRRSKSPPHKRRRSKSRSPRDPRRRSKSPKRHHKQHLKTPPKQKSPSPHHSKNQFQQYEVKKQEFFRSETKNCESKHNSEGEFFKRETSPIVLGEIKWESEGPKRFHTQTKSETSAEHFQKSQRGDKNHSKNQFQQHEVKKQQFFRSEMKNSDSKHNSEGEFFKRETFSIIPEEIKWESEGPNKFDTQIKSELSTEHLRKSQGADESERVNIAGPVLSENTNTAGNKNSVTNKPLRNRRKFCVVRMT